MRLCPIIGSDYRRHSRGVIRDFETCTVCGKRSISNTFDWWWDNIKVDGIMSSLLKTVPSSSCQIFLFQGTFDDSENDPCTQRCLTNNNKSKARQNHYVFLDICMVMGCLDQCTVSFCFSFFYEKIKCYEWYEMPIKMGISLSFLIALLWMSVLLGTAVISGLVHLCGLMHMRIVCKKQYEPTFNQPCKAKTVVYICYTIWYINF